MRIYTRNIGNNYQVVGLEHAQILSGSWRNFSGEARQYDSGSTRHFAIMIDTEENAQKLKDLGFNVGFYQPQNGDGYYHLDINFGWKLRDPMISIVDQGVRILQTEGSVGDIDHLTNISYADIEVSPYHWSNNGRSGVKPWVREMYIYLQEPSPIAKNYASYNQSFEQRSYEPSTVYQPELEFAAVEDEDIPF